MQEDQDFIKSKKFRKEAKGMQKNLQILNKQLEDIQKSSTEQLAKEHEKQAKFVKENRKL